MNIGANLLGNIVGNDKKFESGIGRLPVDVRTWISLSPTELISLNYLPV
jgi:hypothetical protein